MADGTALTSVILALAVPGALWIGYRTRLRGENGDTRGIGWQFIRFTVLTISIPIIAILALNDALDGTVTTLVAGAMAYAFAKTAKED